MNGHKILHIGDECTGCFACYSACPVDAISMVENKEGFYAPAISMDKCISCNLCDKVCPRVNVPSFFAPQKAFYGWSTNDSVRLGSSSGGLFSVLANMILEQGGVVYGAAFNYNEPIRLECRSTDEVSIKSLRKSKYVQCFVGDAFRRIRRDLQEGRKVLYCGTPCEVAGLRSFLRHPYENLLMVDFVCHGVPSMSLLSKHLHYLGLSGIKEIDFRPKLSSWVDKLVIRHNSGVRRIHWTMDEYFDTFEKGRSIRPSCFNCIHADGKRAADITIADFWGVSRYKPELYDKRGISLVLTNNTKGEQYINQLQIMPDIQINELPMEYAAYVYEKPRCTNPEYDRAKRDAYIHDVYSLGYKNANRRHGFYKSPLMLLQYYAKEFLRTIYHQLKR